MSTMRVLSRRGQSLAAISLLALGACADNAPTGPASFGPRFNEVGEELGDRVQVCKASGPVGTYWFSVTHTGGLGIYPSGQIFSITLFNQDFSAAACAVAFIPVKDPLNPNATFTTTVTEINLPDGIVVDSVVARASDGTRLSVEPGPSGSITTTFHYGGFLKFYNGEAPPTPPPPPPPPPGAQGCTPGFWKNSPGSWAVTGYSTSDDFDTVFGVDAFSPNITLLAALNLGGGGTNALARHAVAALLNTAYAGLDYGMTTSAVIDAVQDAFAGGDIEGTKNRLAALNERSCPLANDNSF